MGKKRRKEEGRVRGREKERDEEQAANWVESLCVDGLGGNGSDSGIRLLCFISWLQYWLSGLNSLAC